MRHQSLFKERQLVHEAHACVTEHFDGHDLSDYLNGAINDKEDIERVISQLSRLFLRLRELRAIHGDFKAKNLLVNASGIRLIDTDGMEFLVHRGRFSRKFRSDFKRLLANWEKSSSVRLELESQLRTIFE